MYSRGRGRGEGKDDGTEGDDADDDRPPAIQWHRAMAAKTMQASNRLKTAFAQGRQSMGMWQMLPGANVSRLLARSGVDWVMVDCEHGNMDDGAMHDAVPAIAALGVSPLVRIPDLQSWMVLVPLLRTVEQAKELVQAAKFPPMGRRGFGSPLSAERFSPMPSFTEYLQQANDALLTMVQIETREALDVVEDIAAVDGIDVLFIGPFDLGNSIGHPILDGALAPELKDAIARILAACRKAGKCGMYATSGEQAKVFADQGFDMISVAADYTALEYVLKQQFGASQGQSATSKTGSKETVKLTTGMSKSYSSLHDLDSGSARFTSRNTNGRLSQTSERTPFAPVQRPQLSREKSVMRHACRRRRVANMAALPVGCGKEFTDPGEKCEYHPGPPIFHEGQKGWKCCKPRVLTFDEFMNIPPCTTGTHSTTDKPPQLEEPKPVEDDASLAKKIEALTAGASTPGRAPIQPAQQVPTPPPPPPETDDDDPALEIPDGKACRRRTCGHKYKKGGARDGEKCVHHPGVPIFHEGSKGYSCCKRRVLEFDQFMKIEGCKTKDRHLFIGNGEKKEKAGSSGEEVLDTVRHDFYQTPTSVIASFFLKKINKDTAKVSFESKQLTLDLTTGDSPPKRYSAEVPLYGPIDTEKSSYKVLGTKLELNLVKGDGASWPVLRSDEATTGEILQIGRAGRA
ncbi:zinc-binding protein [Purpureocillium lavendulum]|uniref:Zinc-binding protein n=1 Tax=Purpureocillium lavendulum TaxID=1247861 RepID=A0AB34G431_9HYPO|nr:zinc-binding protein [Purpureocillium lavendulum]